MRLNVLMNDQRNLARGAAVLLIGRTCSRLFVERRALQRRRQRLHGHHQPAPDHRAGQPALSGRRHQWRLWPARGECRALGFAAGRWRQPSGIDGAGRGPLGRAAGRRPENGSAGVACDGQAGKRRARPADLGGGDVHRRPDHRSARRYRLRIVAALQRARGHPAGGQRLAGKRQSEDRPEAGRARLRRQGRQHPGAAESRQRRARTHAQAARRAGSQGASATRQSGQRNGLPAAAAESGAGHTGNL